MENWATVASSANSAASTSLEPKPPTGASSSSQGYVTDHTIDSATGQQAPTSGLRTLSDIVKDLKGYRVGFYEGVFHVFTPFGCYVPPEPVDEFIMTYNCVFTSEQDREDERVSESESEDAPEAPTSTDA